MRHLAAYYQSAEITALTALAAVPDTQQNTFGTNVQVQQGLNNIGFAQGLYDDTSLTKAQLLSASLRTLAPYDVTSPVPTVTQSTVPTGVNAYAMPVPVAVNEYLQFLLNANAGAAKAGYGLVEFVDGAPKPQAGSPFTIQASGAAHLVAGQWVNTPMVMDVVLPAGNYALVGFRPIGANLVASRVAFIGQANRPGCPALPNQIALQDPIYRNGGLGTWGTFNNLTPPTIDNLGATDTVQLYYLDLIKLPN